jgi:CDP-6-deoxy-D-xylo-4-hexulose-3-dehydrase
MKFAFLNENETKKALANFIQETSQFSMGPTCMKFETAFAEKQNRRYAVLFNSGASANLAMLQALKNLGYIKEGDKIGFSALTWSTNVFPIIQLGFVPVAIDCEVNRLNVTSNNLLERLDEVDIKAFFATNVLGFTGDLDIIKQICENKGILFLEDNCESLGTVYKGIKAGNFGLASTFSFFVAHHMSTIEGGMVCTDNYELAQMLKMVRANGWDRNLDVKKQVELRKQNNISSEFIAKYTFYDLGFNMRPTEITGFLGLYQMNFLDDNIKTREANYLNLETYLKDNTDFILPDHTNIDVLSTFAFPIICKDEETRKFYLEQFAGAGIEVRPMIAGNIQNQPFYNKYNIKKYKCEGADFLHNCSFYCGNYPELTMFDLNTIKSCLIRY